MVVKVHDKVTAQPGASLTLGGCRRIISLRSKRARDRGVHVAQQFDLNELLG